MYLFENTNVCLFVNDQLNENEINTYISQGSRDDNIAGTSHIFEHLLIQNLKDQYKEELEINGHTGRDYIKVSARIEEYLLVNYINEFVHKNFIEISFDEDQFEMQKEIIEQELAIHRNNPQARLQEIMFQTAFKDRDLSKPLYSNDYPSLKEVKDLFENADEFKLTLVVSSLVFEKLKKMYNLEKIYSNFFWSPPSLQTSPNEKPKVHYIQDDVVNSNMVTIGMLCGLIDIDQLNDYSDLHLIQIVTKIIDNRLKSLRNLGVYFSLGFPSYHRKEVKITLLFSSSKNKEKTILDKIHTLISDPIKQKELPNSQDKMDDDKEINEIKEQLSFLYNNDVFFTSKEINYNRLVSIQTLIVKKLSDIIIINKKEHSCNEEI